MSRSFVPDIKQTQMSWPNEEKVGTYYVLTYNKIWGHRTSCRFLVCQKCWKWQGIRRVSLCLQIEVIKLCIKFTHKGCLTNFTWRWSNIRRKREKMLVKIPPNYYNSPSIPTIIAQCTKNENLMQLQMCVQDGLLELNLALLGMLLLTLAY